MSAVLTAAHRARRIWWRLRRPRTYGVKALLTHPGDTGLFLAVRHSYIDQDRWALPGGRYHPVSESVGCAARREVREELGVDVAGELHVLTKFMSKAEGKRDTVTILSGTAATETVQTSLELRDARWIRTDLGNLPPGTPTSKWLRMALEVEADPA